VAQLVQHRVPDIVPLQHTRVNRKFLYFGFDVLRAVTMQSTIFWDVTSWSAIETDQRFRATYCLHLQGRRLLAGWLPAWLILRP
jgi:hypothetical protein